MSAEGEKLIVRLLAKIVLLIADDEDLYAEQRDNIFWLVRDAASFSEREDGDPF